MVRTRHKANERDSATSNQATAAATTSPTTPKAGEPLNKTKSKTRTSPLASNSQPLNPSVNGSRKQNSTPQEPLLSNQQKKTPASSLNSLKSRDGKHENQEQPVAPSTDTRRSKRKGHAKEISARLQPPPFEEPELPSSTRNNTDENPHFDNPSPMPESRAVDLNKSLHMDTSLPRSQTPQPLNLIRPSRSSRSSRGKGKQRAPEPSPSRRARTPTPDYYYNPDDFDDYNEYEPGTSAGRTSNLLRNQSHNIQSSDSVLEDVAEPNNTSSTPPPLHSSEDLPVSATPPPRN
ncbi:hypothetical protein BGZ76_007098, partial [Entomortierella beljakovae]